MQCISCWQRNFVQCTRGRVANSDLHRIYAFNQELTGSAALASLITGHGVPPEIRRIVLYILDEVRVCCT